MSPPMAVTEDTPADMLAGSMDLHIVLPSGHVVRTSVLRSTPMMDLLVQVTTAHRLSPGSHSLQAMGERGALPFKPSTPIGALDTFTVRIVQKKSGGWKKAQVPVPDVLPHTFRLQVHLPRGQLFVMRVTPQVLIRDVLKQVCREKNLDPVKYELRKTGTMSQILESENTLGQVQTQELTLVVRGTDHDVRSLSSADIMHVKQANNRERSVCDSSLSSGSLGSRSVSPVVAPAPQPPTRKKRRPAPKPPENLTRSVVISHSRESSDSSGYHEPSTLSESPTHNGPPSDISSSARGLANSHVRNSASMSNLTCIPNTRLNSCVSVTSLSSNGPSKKKRAPPPPPIAKAPPAIPTEEHKQEIKQKSATLPADIRRQPDPIIVPPAPVELAPSPPPTPDCTQKLPTPPTPAPRAKLTKQPSVDEDDDELETIPLPHIPKKSSTKTIIPVIQESTMHESNPERTESPSDSLTWEYQLPPPPTHFRDTSPQPEPIIYEDTEKPKPPPTPPPQPQPQSTQQKILHNKSEVMNELTNILSQNRLQDPIKKSQSFSSLHNGSKHQLNHSQSLITNPPISNFKISNYEPRSATTVEDIPEFKKPDPVVNTKKIRRADSMNVKRINMDKDKLQQHFLEFLKERDIPVEFVDDVTDIIPSHVVIDTKVHDEEEKKITQETEKPVEKKEEVVIVQQETRKPAEVVETKPEIVIIQQEVKKPVEKKQSWQQPQISMGTWGDRPKTKITIKDEDYTTEVLIPEKPTPQPVKPIQQHQLKPITERKIKKPTNYQLFSSLVRKMDEEEEQQPKQPPVICGVELKKQFRSEPDLIQGLDLTKTRLMPVVKGFRVPVRLEPVDPRGELLEQIRAFGGLNRLRKTAQ